MRLFRPGFISGWIYPEAIFRIKTDEKVLYLTFDDGPDPDSTQIFIDILDKYNVKALFFCSGKAAEKHPELIEKIISKGNVVGNHGYNHLNGWLTDDEIFENDILHASSFTSSELLRPPYGRLKISQYRRLKSRFRIIFWDIMPYDFDPLFGGINSLQVLKSKMRPGSIIALHDNPDCSGVKILEEFIIYALKMGYSFDLPPFATKK
jgi:peptidoglycan-N-acetylglucosamine deacetylase